MLYALIFNGDRYYAYLDSYTGLELLTSVNPLVYYEKYTEDELEMVMLAENIILNGDESNHSWITRLEDF